MKSFFSLAILLSFTAAPALFAQFEAAEVLGTVHDPSGAGIPKATVTLTSQDTGIELKTTTDEGGAYDFFHVKVGHYTLTFEQAGFSKTTAQDVTVDVNA